MAHDISDCKAVFVTWAWLAGIVAGMIGSGACLAYVYAKAETAQDVAIERVERRVSSLDGVAADLDTVKALLRGR